MLLDVLYDALDPASKDILEARREENPELTYGAFWRQMEREFEVDLSDTCGKSGVE